MNARDRPQMQAFTKAFINGLVVVALLYGLLAGELRHLAPNTLRHIQAGLPSVTTAIELPTHAVYGPPVPENPTATHVIDTSPVSSDATALPEAPIDGLYETTTKGRLPVVRKSDGMTPFKAYRRPFDRASVKEPIISIAIMDMGISTSASQTALTDMPPDVSFDLSPYAVNADEFVAEARKKGHEVWLTLPMESDDYPRVDTGADTLLIGMPEQQNSVKLAQALGSAAGYAGVIASHNPAFMRSLSDIKPILNAIYDRGLGFIDSSATPGAEIQALAMHRNSPYASVDIWIDMPATPEDIEKALSRLEQKAREHGSAVGLIRPLPVSFQEVGKWITGLKDKGLVLAPMSAQTGM